MNRNKIIYHIITTATIVIPTITMLVLNAIFFSITPDLIVYDANIEDITIISSEEQYVLKGGKSYGLGHITIKDNEMVAIIDENSIIKIDWKYYMLDANELKLVERKLIQEKTSWAVPISIFIGGFAVFIAFLIIAGKMKLFKKDLRLATLIALLTASIIISIISLIVVNMEKVFWTITISWAVYYIEYLVYNGKLKANEQEKVESDLIRQLKGLVK